MLIHAVYFWLKDSLSAAEKAEFRKGVESLAKIEVSTHTWVGVPSKTERPGIVERSYSIGLVVAFKDMAAHDAYQVHPIHLAFLAKHKTDWAKIVVYDSE